MSAKEASALFGSARALSIIGALAASAAAPAHAQTDLIAAKQAVRGCVGQVQQEATRPENYQFGQPPMWRNFDAYLSPDGRVHNNAKLVGEQDGVYRFEKCLADHAFSVGSAASSGPPIPSDPCTQDEIDNRPGDCWIKLAVWEKRLIYTGFVYGWLHSYRFAERQQYDRLGSSHIRFCVVRSRQVHFLS